MLIYILFSYVISSVYAVSIWNNSLDEPAEIFPGDVASTTSENITNFTLSNCITDKLPELWTDCYQGDENLNTVHIGVAVDDSYANLFDSKRDIKDEIIGIVNDTNRYVYTPQLNIHLEVNSWYIRRNNKNWNNCSLSMNGQLKRFRDWSTTRNGKHRSIWILFTNCHPSPGTVGMAYIGALCHQGANVAIVNHMNELTWILFAHELGHSFGAHHSFEDGVGETGGIMDYGDGSLDGIFQFNTKYRKPEICKELSNLFGYCHGCYDDTSRCVTRG